MASPTNKRMKCLTVLEKDRIGLLADITEELGKNDVNIESVSIDVTSAKQAIIRILTTRYAAAKKILKKKGFRVLDSNVMLICLQDRPGELAKASKILSDAGININNVYVMTRGWKKEVICGLETSDNEKARKLLKEYL